MKVRVSCEDKYECQKLSSLILVKDSNETYISKILNILNKNGIIYTEQIFNSYNNQSDRIDRVFGQ